MEQDAQDGHSLDPAKTTVAIGVERPDGSEALIDVPLAELFAAYLTIHGVGYNNAVGLINFAAGASQELVRQGAPPRSFEAMLRLLEDRRSPVDVSKKERERRVLEFCYLLRVRVKISLTKSAQIASALLGEEIDPEPWRKKLERYADREGKPQPGRPRRKRQHI